jgi:hypothetical protein
MSKEEALRTAEATGARKKDEIYILVFNFAK